MFNLKKLWQITGQPLNYVSRETIKEDVELSLQRDTYLHLASLYKTEKMMFCNSNIFKQRIASNS